MAAHRYWRVNCQSGGLYGIFAIAEVSLRTVAGGANVATGGTAIQSSNFSGQPAALAFDGNAATFWGSATLNPGEWIGYDFGAGVTKDIVEFAISARNDATSEGARQAPKTGTLQYSDDGATWTTSLSFTGATWSIGETRTFPGAAPVTTPHRYWRVYASANNGGGNNLDIAEIAMRLTAGGANQCTGGTAIGSHDATGFEFAKAFDGSNSTTWYVNLASFALPQWVGYDFGAGVTKNIVEMALTCFAASEMPRDFLLQYSDDGAGWLTSRTIVQQTNWAAAETREFSTPQGNGTARLEAPKVGQAAVEGPPAGGQIVDIVGQSVVEGAPTGNQVVDTTNQYIVEGSPTGRLVVDILSMYVIEGPLGYIPRRRSSYISG